MSRRVVITGIGLVSALGIGTEPTWKGVLAGTSGVSPITRFDVSAYAARIAAEVKGFDPLQFLEKKDVKKMDLFIQYAVAASQSSSLDGRSQHPVSWHLRSRNASILPSAGRGRTRCLVAGNRRDHQGAPGASCSSF